MPTDNTIPLKSISSLTGNVVLHPYDLLSLCLSSPLVHALHTWQLPSHKCIFRLKLSPFFAVRKAVTTLLLVFWGVTIVINHLSRFLY